MAKALAKRTLAVATIAVLLFSPFLLLVDFAGFAPLVLTVWLLSAVYFIFFKSRS